MPLIISSKPMTVKTGINVNKKKRKGDLMRQIQKTF